MKAHTFNLKSRSVVVLGFDGRDDAVEFAAAVALFSTGSGEASAKGLVKYAKLAKEFAWGLRDQKDIDDFKKEAKKSRRKA